jgi:hypothetical protein
MFLCFQSFVPCNANYFTDVDPAASSVLISTLLAPGCTLELCHVVLRELFVKLLIVLHLWINEIPVRQDTTLRMQVQLEY